LGDLNIGRKKLKDLLEDYEDKVCIAKIIGTFKKNSNQLDHVISNCANA